MSILRFFKYVWYLTFNLEFNERVYEICRKIPKGRVSTYKEIAEALGIKAYRAVGRALRDNPYAPEVPCYRVLNSRGELYGFQGKKTKIALDNKKRLLEQEGIEFKGNSVVNFKKVFYKLR